MGEMGCAQKRPGREADNEGTSLLIYTNLFSVFKDETECQKLQKALLNLMSRNGVTGDIQGQEMQSDAHEMRQPQPRTATGSERGTATLGRVLGAVLDSSQKMSI